MAIKSLNDKMAGIQYDKIPLLISQSYAPASRTSNNSTDTSWVTLGTVTIIGNTMNLNGKCVIESSWRFPASASTKQIRLDWGGFWVAGPYITGATYQTADVLIGIKNANSKSSQILLNTYSYGLSAENITSTVDTSNNTNIDLRCSWNANVAAETITLLGYSVWYYPGNT